MARGDELRGLAQAFEELGSLSDAYDFLRDAQASAANRYRVLFLDRLEGWRDADRHRMAAAGGAITNTTTTKLLDACWPLVDSFTTSELSGAARLDTFGAAWPRLGDEFAKQVEKLADGERLQLARTVQALVIGGFLVGAAMAHQQSDAELVIPWSGEEDAAPTPEGLTDAANAWHRTWRMSAHQMTDAGWAMLRMIGQPSAVRFNEVATSLGVGKKKRHRRALETAIFGYLGSGYTLYRSFTREQRVHLMDSFSYGDFSYAHLEYHE